MFDWESPFGTVCLPRNLAAAYNPAYKRPCKQHLYSTACNSRNVVCYVSAQPENIEELQCPSELHFTNVLSPFARASTTASGLDITRSAFMKCSTSTSTTPSATPPR